MKRHILFSTLSIILICIYASVNAIYADDPSEGRIRSNALKKNEKLFNKVAIDLVNGKSRQVPLDNMVKILRGYNIVEIRSKDMKPAEEIILKEVAYRMIKQHYLPRLGDKIRVYKADKEFEKDTGIGSLNMDSLEANIRLPLEVAAVRDDNEIKALYWQDMITQVSASVEKLWLNRILLVNNSLKDKVNQSDIVEAAVLLRKKFIQQQELSQQALTKNPAALEIVVASKQRFISWTKAGLVDEQDIPALAEMMIQFIILSGDNDARNIADQIRAFKDPDSFNEALLNRIKKTSDVIKNYNPTDYAAFAMLQSLLDEVSDNFSEIRAHAADKPFNINAVTPESPHSSN